MSAAGALVGRRVCAQPGPKPPGLHTRLVARVRAIALDRQLADGALPWHSTVHAARAVQLTSPRSRDALARSLERLLGEADAPSTQPRAAVPPCVEQVLAARRQILEIGTVLRSRVPADCRGIAKLRVILSDGAGPFYVRAHPTALAVALNDVSRWLNAMD